MKRINETQLHKFLQELIDKDKLYGVEDIRWEKLKKVPSLELPVGPRLLSPKEIIHPQDETLFIHDGEKIQPPSMPKEKIVWGIRPCDAKALQLIDKVFLETDPIDPYYKERRDAAVFISVACTKLLPTCFCTTFDSEAPFKLYGADILLLPLDGHFYVLDENERGKKITKDWEEVTELPQDFEKIKNQLITELENTSPSVADLKELLKEKFNDFDFWKELGYSCLGCGICTYLCPTCYCFDIATEKIANRVRRARYWDSCQFALFTLEASGHNPRPTQHHRIRQRFMHKLSFFPERYNEYLCTGCGRCITNCPAGIDIRELIESAKRKTKNAK